MRNRRIDIDEHNARNRQPTGAPPLAVELAIVAGAVIAAFLLYGRPRLADLFIAWLSQ